MKNSVSFESAVGLLLESSSSADEKLGALAYLESIATYEALVALRKAMELKGLYVSERHRNDPHLPLYGEVAAAAALALGRLEELGGVKILLQIILSSDQSPELRECALYGLGGLTSDDVFEAYAAVLEIDNDLLTNMALKSANSSYHRLGNVSSTSSQQLLHILFSKLLKGVQGADYSEHEAAIVSLISRNMQRDLELEIKSLAQSSDLISERPFALRVMFERSSSVAAELAASILSQAGGDPELYLSIGKKFEGSDEPALVESARFAMEKPQLARRLAAIILPSVRLSREAQLKAADLILNGKKQISIESELEFTDFDLSDGFQ